MDVNSFYIKKIALTGAGIKSAEITFNRGLNVISGPSDTGKTYIVQCIDYMFGGGDLPKPIPEASKYTTIEMTINVPSTNDSFTLERSLRGGGFKIYRRNSEVSSLSNKHGGGNSLSEYLLNLIGMLGTRVQTNKNGKTRDISFRDIAKLIVVSEEEIISSGSPFLSGIPTSATAEKGVFKTLLTGVDYSSVIEVEDQKVSKSIMVGKTQMI